MTSDTDIKTKCGFVALLGAPNAGKSTLMNAMVGAKVSIVTQKVQTTRTRILGVTVLDDTQLVFVDTPGIFKPRRRLDRAMVAAAWGGAADADIVALLIDAGMRIEGDTRRIIDGLRLERRVEELTRDEATGPGPGRGGRPSVSSREGWRVV